MTLSLFTALVIIVVVATISALAWGIARHVSHRLIYKPTRTSHREPQTLASDISHEVVWFKTTDGKTLHGWFCSRVDNTAVMLICHGNKGSLEGREDTVEFYMKMGLNVFIFDYRGYGHSNGHPSERGTELDVLAAWHHLRDERMIHAQDIVLLGRSLGAAIAAQLAQHKTPGAVILESTFSSILAIAGELHPRLKRFLSRHVSYDTASKISAITSPLLLVHSEEDELIGFHHAKTLHNLASERTKLIPISGRHRDGFFTSREVYRPAVLQFLNECKIALNTATQYCETLNKVEPLKEHQTARG